MSSKTTPQDAQSAKVYLGLNTLEFSAICR